MKARNSNPELNYNLTEGKHKKTLLEKYLNQWSGEERVNGSVNLEKSHFVNELVENTENKFSPSVVKEYKKFLNEFDNFNNGKELIELDSLIKSKRFDELSQKPLSKENILNLIKKTYE